MTTTQAAQTDGVDAAHDVVEFLIGQHMQIRDLFTEVEKSTGKARRDAFERLVKLLAVHETAEEQLIHPLVRTGVHGGGDIVDDRLSEEREAKEMLVKLEDVGPDSNQFPLLLAKLRASVLAHAHNEEAYEFRYLRREVAASELQPLVSGGGHGADASASGCGVRDCQHRRRSGDIAVRPDEGHGPRVDVHQPLNARSKNLERMRDVSSSEQSTRCSSGAPSPTATTQRYRVGPNYLQLPVNSPKDARVATNEHDGQMTYFDQGRADRRGPAEPRTGTGHSGPVDPGADSAHQ
jgi:hypothetical protein